MQNTQTDLQVSKDLFGEYTRQPQKLTYQQVKDGHVSVTDEVRLESTLANLILQHGAQEVITHLETMKSCQHQQQ